MLHLFDLAPDAARWDSHFNGRDVSVCSCQLTDHARLVRIEGKIAGPRHLVVPPVSGHAGTLMLDLVLALLEAGPVEIVEIHEGDQHAVGAPEIGWRDQCQAISAALAAGPAAHLIGACQSTAATLHAAAQAPEVLAGLTLIAAPLDRHPASGGVARHIPSAPGRELVEFRDEIEKLTRLDGSGRMVLPGDVQLAAIMSGKGGASRVLLEESCILWNPVVSASRRSRARARVRILSRAQSIDRRLLLEALEQNFIHRSYVADASKILCPVHLVAGENDEIIPAPQVFGAAHIFTGAEVVQTIAPGADHFDLFCGESAMQLGHSISEYFLSAS